MTGNAIDIDELGTATPPFTFKEEPCPNRQ
jgi:hypothetical protein